MLPRVIGRISRNYWGDDHFVFECYHHFPGNLNKGRIRAEAFGSNVKGLLWSKVESFETWRPNEEEAKTFYIPISEVTPEGKIEMKFEIEASNAPTATYKIIWENGDWKSFLVKVPNK